MDAPDFNLRLELDLKQAGIKTVHYVSPSVWAWRQKNVSLRSKLQPTWYWHSCRSRKHFYDKFNVPCEFIGHTLADAIPLVNDKAPARELLGLEQDRKWLAVLPGSRGSELKKMLSQPFIETCKKLHQRYPELGFVVAVVNPKRREQFEQAWQELAPELEFKLVDDTARNVITASDAVLLASGTVALECMLLKRPMVVGYRVNAITAFLARKLLKTPYVSLPNILAERELVKEFLQEECTAENLFTEVTQLLEGDTQAMIDKFTEMHHWIRKGADQQAATAVLNLIAK
ncbi:lipid-A-disaccharide synthase [Vibrio sinaloensis]|nr:lipid-A-disaccharide synthase [Vibrio sinaloensis]